MDVKLLGPRYLFEPTADGIRVVIPAPRNWLAVGFFSLWLVGWFFGESTALAQLLGLSWNGTTPKHVQPAFLSAWLLAWTVGGVVVAASLMWQLAGREVITTNALSLTRRIEAVAFRITRSYALNDIRDLRVAPQIDSRYSRQRAMFPWSGPEGSGTIAFDYGARTIRFAPGLDEAEAKMLIADLKRRVKV